MSIQKKSVSTDNQITRPDAQEILNGHKQNQIALKSLDTNDIYMLLKKC
jgi:hypothetical protein